MSIEDAEKAAAIHKEKGPFLGGVGGAGCIFTQRMWK